MAKSYATLQAIIKAKLEALMDEQAVPASIFAGVYTTNVTNPEGYPIAYVVEKGGTSTIVDTHRNERRWQFSVVVHYALGDETEADANANLLATVDRVIAMFDQDPMLVDENGEEQCKKVSAAPVLVERSSQDVAVIRALITVEVVDLVPRYTAA